MAQSDSLQREGRIVVIAVSMPVPVMRIRKMGMGVRQRRMPVHVPVGRTWCHWFGVGVGVVHIATIAVDIAVAVPMIVQQRLMGMRVTVLLSQVQCDADGHQRGAAVWHAHAVALRFLIWRASSIPPTSSG